MKPVQRSQSIWNKIWEIIRDGGMAARDARIGAVGAQQIRDLYSEGKDKEAQKLAEQYAKANINGIVMAVSAANPYGLIGDVAAGSTGALANTAVEGDASNLKDELVTSALFDIAGKGVGDALTHGWSTAKNHIGILPETMNLPSKTWGELKDEFYNGIKSAYDRYSKALKSPKAQNIRNRFADKSQQLLSDVPKRDNIHNKSDLVHTYRHYVDKNTGETLVDVDAFSGKDLVYAGHKAGAEIALGQFAGASYPSNFYIPPHYQQLFYNRNNYNNLASLMALKSSSGIPASFDAISDADIEKVFRKGWSKGLWNPVIGHTKLGPVKQSADEFWETNKNAIKRLMYTIPVTTGAIINANKKGDR